MTDTGLVHALVGTHILDSPLVALREHGADFVHAQLAVAGPPLVALGRVDPAGDPGALLLLALVGVDLSQIDLGKLGQPVLNLVCAERVVVRDNQVRLGGRCPLDGAERVWRNRRPSGTPARSGGGRGGFESVERAPQQTRDVDLRVAHPISDLALREVACEAQLEHLALLVG
jgi:hypothetical protein